MKKLFSFIIVLLIGCSNQHTVREPLTDTVKTKSKAEKRQETPKYEESMIKKADRVTEPKLDLKFTEIQKIRNTDLQNKINLESNHPPKRETLNKVLLNVPMVNQMPELYNGCEIASITMMLQHAGVKVDKFKVAKNIPRDNDPFNMHLEM